MKQEDRPSMRRSDPRGYRHPEVLRDPSGLQALSGETPSTIIA
jgi:hypothetical protein